MEKKRFRPFEQLREDVQQKRASFAKAVKRLRADRLVFLDESGFNQAMATMTGWSPRGERLLAHRPVNWGGNLSVVGAIRAAGVVCHQIVRGAFNAERFVAFARDRLAPRLRAGDVVVLDNLRAHKDKRVAEAIEAVGAQLLFLPPYSPDLNPEPMWGFAKNRVRAVAARTADAVRLAIRRALRAVPTRHLRSWYSHCGFEAQLK